MTALRPFRKSCALPLLCLLSCFWGCNCKGEPSDEDVIEKFIEDITGEVDGGYVARAMAYVDFENYPVDVRVPRYAGVYTAAQGAEIEKQFRKVIKRRFAGTELRRRSSRYEIDGDRAEVHLGLLSAVGPLRAELELTKAAPLTWKVNKVHIETRF